MFLVVTALFEGATGVLLLLAPSLVFAFLLGLREVEPEMMLVGRLAGAALLGLSVASWFASSDGSRARRGLLAGLLIYNVAAVVLLAFAGAVLKMAGLLLWPAVFCHVALTLWNAGGLRCRRGQEAR